MAPAPRLGALAVVLSDTHALLVRRGKEPDRGLWGCPGGHVEPGESALQAAALSHHAVHLADPLEALRRLGGREIAALAGAILAARTQKVPVLLDGISALAAAATLHALNREAVAHCMVADGAGASGRIARALGLQSVIQLGMQTSDAAAGAIAAGVVQAAAFCHAAAGASLRRR